MEIASILYLAYDEGYVGEAALEPVLDQMEELARRIVAFNRSLSVPTSKVNLPKRAGAQALVPRPSALDQD